MPYGQSPWASAAEGMGGMGNSMARIAMAQQVGKMRAQQFAQQMAIRQAQEQINRDRLNAQIPEYQARTYQAQSAGDKNYQGMARQDQMDELARAVAVNKFRQMVPGGVPAVLSGDVTGQPGPTQAGADVLNQGDMVRNVLQLIGMHNPNELSTMMVGKNIPRGDVNYNPLTEEKVQGNPPAQPTGAPIDPQTGMTPYQFQQLLLQKSRLSDEEKRISNVEKRLKLDPRYSMVFGDDSTSDEAKADSTGSSSSSSSGGMSGGGKQLDAQTAAKFLQQSGGDKEKARALAKQQGYTF